jgi:ubiquinone/menaquinone biosynthesis C-methylase UbiE
MDRKIATDNAYQFSRNIYDDVLTQKKLWAKLYNRFFWDVDDFEIARRVLENIPPGFSGRLLDVPAGTGVFTAGAYKGLPHAAVMAVDRSEDMLNRMRARCAGNGAENVTCARADVAALPYADAEFDLVLSMNGFHAFPEKNKAFSETARVLKPGGIFCGCLYIRGCRRRSDIIVARILARKGWFTPPFWTKDELTEILERFYSMVDVRTVNAIACFRCVK